MDAAAGRVLELPRPIIPLNEAGQKGKLLEFIPAHQAKFQQDVGNELRKIDNRFSAGQTQPVAQQPVLNQQTIAQTGAENIDHDDNFTREDVAHGVGALIQGIFGGVTHIRENKSLGWRQRWAGRLTKMAHLKRRVSPQQVAENPGKILPFARNQQQPQLVSKAA